MISAQQVVVMILEIWIIATVVTRGCG